MGRSITYTKNYQSHNCGLSSSKNVYYCWNLCRQGFLIQEECWNNNQISYSILSTQSDFSTPHPPPFWSKIQIWPWMGNKNRPEVPWYHILRVRLITHRIAYMSHSSTYSEAWIFRFFILMNKTMPITVAISSSKITGTTPAITALPPFLSTCASVTPAFRVVVVAGTKGL